MSVIGNSIVFGVNTNRNLLDNPWFTVNQRGVSSWSSASGSLSYGVDRWMAYYSSITIQSDNSLTIVGSTSEGGIVQRMERMLNIGGKVVTISAIIDDVLYDVTTTFPSASSGQQESVIVSLSSDITVDLRDYNNNGGNTFLQFYIKIGGSSHNIKAVKLELGSVSTLANDVAPNYIDELLRCERYYIGIESSGWGKIGMAIANTTTTAILTIMTPVKMRTDPTITFGGTISTVTNKIIGVTSITNTYARELFIEVGLTVDSATVGYTDIMQFAATGGYFRISADL